MASEYLKRTPTSSGNRKQWTWAGWIKINKDFGSSNYNTVWSVAAGTSADNSDRFHLYHYADGRWGTTGTTSMSAIFTGPGGSAANSRDPGSWMHICLSCNTTISSLTPDKIQRFWINGIEYIYDDLGNISQNANLAINGVYEHIIGARDSSPSRTYDGQMFDLYLVDGQALTPEVFGFYKDGDGYMSSGTTQATDFRPGQWSPRLPKSIKYTIDRSGGFGANGFYLPMNDSSNPGADFHCNPNSIITLKGEDLPQPRNGAPTTSDAYVSQLRDDPFAANLVLAVPGISTSTSGNLITNGHFDTDTTGWTAQNAVISQDEGELRVDDSANAGGYSSANQVITTVIGKRYTMTFDIITTSATPSVSVYQSGWSAAAGSTFYSTFSSIGRKQISFTALSTGSTISLQTSGTSFTVYDNIVVKQEDEPRDYSADIKGSGTNKTVTPTASSSSGIAYDVPSYYGSSTKMNSGASDGLLLGWDEGLADYNFGTGNFTMEAWVYTNTTPTTPWWSIFRSKNYNDNAAGGGLSFYGNSSALRPYDHAGGTTTDLYGGNIGSIPNQQWTHVAIVRDNGRLLTFCNGVCVGNIANTASYENNGFEIGQNFPWDGYIQDIRIYKGVAKYKGGFDVPKIYTPVGIEAFRTTADTCKNNFATWNTLTNHHTDPLAISNGSLTMNNYNVWRSALATHGVSSGKWYYEMKSVNDNQYLYLGWGNSNANIAQYPSEDNNAWAMRIDEPKAYHDQTGDNTQVPLSPAFTQNDIVGCAFDADNGRIWWSRNGVWLTADGNNDGNPATGSKAIYSDIPTGVTYHPMASVYSETAHTNFGQNPSFSGTVTAGTNADGNGKGLFKYAPPSGYLALCEDNLPAPAIADPGKHFKTVLWSGDGNSGRGVTGVGFKPDLIWIKDRGDTSSHSLFDSVRGPGIWLGSNSNSAEQTSFVNVYNPSFNDDGFSVGTDGAVNGSGSPYVAWCWKAGGAAVSNSDGTLTSQVSVNQDAGFSIISLNTGSGGNFTVGHGLATAPKFFITKARNQTYSWTTYHHSMGNDKYIYLDSDAAPVTTTSVWQNTAPSSSVIYGNSTNWGTADYIIYAWAEIEGFSKFGTYEGNNSTDGPFVYCGFKPAWVMYKRTDINGNWAICDSSRNSTNPLTLRLFADQNYADSTGVDPFDFVSNGFKFRTDAASANGGAASTYIFMAFAESPFQTANSK